MPRDATHDMLITIVTAISVGVILIIVARKLRLPSIVMLLAGGVAFGPSGFGLVQPSSLGDGLLVVVSLAVGLILFEGGLTLDVAGYRTAPRMIKRLLTIGVATTWLMTALALLVIVGLPRQVAIGAASLVIVTGPTVIAPLLKRVRVNDKLNSILHWEGVLIDPIGVFIALLCFEWISGATGPEALGSLGIRLAAGLSIGAIGGAVMTGAVRLKVVPEDMINVFALAMAVLTFGVAEAIKSEAGLLSVTVAGFIFGLSGSHRLKQVRQFKAELTDLLIGTLFILLAARLSLDQFRTFGAEGFAVVAVVMFLVRPVSILLCSWRLDLSGSEKAFLGWVAPRGIVAASMASIFAIRLAELGTVEDPKFIETFTYSVIITTIVLQGLTAGPIARWLGVGRSEPTGWLIIGAHLFARRVARFLERSAGRSVILVDTNARHVRAARKEGLTAVLGDARESAIQDRPEIRAIGNVLALTDNEDLNVRLCQRWIDVVGPDGVYRCDPSGRGPSSDDDESETSTIVWPDLPRPSLVAGELLRGEATLVTAKGPSSRLARRATPLLAVEGDRVTFDPDPPDETDATDAADAEAKEEAPRYTLYLDRQADYLERSLRRELIFEIDAADQATLFEAFLDRVIQIVPTLPREQTLHNLLGGDGGGFPIALGQGVALPHAYCPDLDARLCAIVRIPGGVDMAAHDGEPVRLVFLLLSPPGDPEGHLETLAEIARRVHDEDTRRRLFEAASPEAMMEIIRATGAERP